MQIPPTSSTPPPFAGLGSGPTPTPSAAEQQFNDWAKQTPAQQMRAEVLRELGYNEDDLKNMDAQDRAKVEEKIKELTKEKVQQATEKKTGVVIDIKA